MCAILYEEQTGHSENAVSPELSGLLVYMDNHVSIVDTDGLFRDRQLERPCINSTGLVQVQPGARCNSSLICRSIEINHG